MQKLIATGVYIEIMKGRLIFSINVLNKYQLERFSENKAERYITESCHFPLTSDCHC